MIMLLTKIRAIVLLFPLTFSIQNQMLCVVNCRTVVCNIFFDFFLEKISCTYIVSSEFNVFSGKNFDRRQAVSMRFYGFFFLRKKRGDVFS